MAENILVLLCFKGKKSRILGFDSCFFFFFLRDAVLSREEHVGP